MIVTANDCEWEIRSALERGVSGYLLGGCPLSEIVVGVRAVRGGMRDFSPCVSQRLAESLSTEPVTSREEEVLRLVVDGLCNRVVGRNLGIAVGTVKSHLKAIFEKLQVETRTQAVLTVGRRGLLRGNTNVRLAEWRGLERGLTAARSAGHASPPSTIRSKEVQQAERFASFQRARSGSGCAG